MCMIEQMQWVKLYSFTLRRFCNLDMCVKLLVMIMSFSYVAIDPDGLLCQSRDQQGWHGTRSNKGVCGQGETF